MRDGLIWYEIRSFGAGEPHLVFEKSGFLPLTILLGSGNIFFLILGAAVIISKKRFHTPDEPEETTSLLPGSDLISLKERIIPLLKTSGREQFQSEIVKNLGLPKPTVSASLNDLHQRGIIQKIKKGRENLIRLK